MVVFASQQNTVKLQAITIVKTTKNFEKYCLLFPTDSRLLAKPQWECQAFLDGVKTLLTQNSSALSLSIEIILFIFST